MCSKRKEDTIKENEYSRFLCGNAAVSKPMEMVTSNQSQVYDVYLHFGSVYRYIPYITHSLREFNVALSLYVLLLVNAAAVDAGTGAVAVASLLLRCMPIFDCHIYIKPYKSVVQRPRYALFCDCVKNEYFSEISSFRIIILAYIRKW